MSNEQSAYQPVESSLDGSKLAWLRSELQKANIPYMISESIIGPRLLVDEKRVLEMLSILYMPIGQLNVFGGGEITWADLPNDSPLFEFAMNVESGAIKFDDAKTIEVEPVARPMSDEQGRILDIIVNLGGDNQMNHLLYSLGAKFGTGENSKEFIFFKVEGKGSSHILGLGIKQIKPDGWALQAVFHKDGTYAGTWEYQIIPPRVILSLLVEVANTTAGHAEASVGTLFNELIKEQVKAEKYTSRKV